MIDWEKLRNMMRQDLMKFISQDKLTDKDYCDLKLILSNMERSYTNQMFEENEGNNFSGNLQNGRHTPNYYAQYDDMNNRSYGNRHAYYDDMSGRNRNYNRPSYDDYSGHGQEEIFKSQLQAMYHTAEDSNTRRVIQEAMNKLR